MSAVRLYSDLYLVGMGIIVLGDDFLKIIIYYMAVPTVCDAGFTGLENY